MKFRAPPKLLLWGSMSIALFTHNSISVTCFSTASWKSLDKQSKQRLYTPLHLSTLDKNEDEQTKRVVIVGGGVGGLAVAARVASSLQRNKVQSLTSTPGVMKEPSWEVIVLEKNSKELTGGRCGSFDVTVPGLGVFRHERGPSLLLLKNEYEQLFQSCLEKDPYKTASSPSIVSEQYGLKMEQCIPAYQVVFEDGDVIDLGFPNKIQSFDDVEYEELRILEQKSREKMNELEADGASKWDAYMKATSAFLDCGLPNFIEERIDLISFPAFLREALKDGGKAWPLKPHSDVLDALFSSQKMKALASFQDLYVGLEPYKNEKVFGGGVIKKTAPAVFGLLAALELHPTNKKAGVFAPVGGFRAVGEAFQKLAESFDAQIQFDSAVTQIEANGVHYTNANKSVGKNDSHFLHADLVIVNADLPYATQTLLSARKEKRSSTDVSPPKETFDWDESFDYSSGVIAFHWSLDKQLEKLNTHNVFLIASDRSQSEKSWQTLRDNPSFAEKEVSIEPFNFYVHRPVKTDPSAAPDGCDSIMVLVPCPTLTRKEEYSKLPREESIEQYKSQINEDYIDSVRMAVIKRFEVVDGLKGLKDHIVHEVVDTPGTYAGLYNVGAGVPFGLSHGFNQLSLTRPAAECKDMDNVLYVGASSRPGNGVPLVLIGAKSVADKAMRRIKAMSSLETDITITK